MIKLLFATGNEHKVGEIREILPATIEILALKDLGITEDIPETTGTIAGNAKQKTTFLFNKYKTNVFAEDTGLEVHALDGRPGVDTAHYSGSRDSIKNMNLLLYHLQDVQEREAQFRTVISLIWQEKYYQFEGVMKGTISVKQQGYGGFGYDPIFIPDGYKHTLAELGSEIKNKISHRAKAVNQLIDFLNTPPN